MSENYRRYLQNQIRDMFSFEGVSIKLIFKGKKESELEQ